MAPLDDWTCLNTNGCLKTNTSQFGCGGLLREASANWIHGFSYNLGSCSVVEVEIRGILQGLRLAWSLGFRRLLLATYSLLVVKWLQGP